MVIDTHQTEEEAVPMRADGILAAIPATLIMFRYSYRVCCKTPSTHQKLLALHSPIYVYYRRMFNLFTFDDSVILY